MPRPCGTRTRNYFSKVLRPLGYSNPDFVRLGLTSHLFSHHNNIVSQKDAQIAALAAMNTALSSELQKAKAMIPNADLQFMESMKKDAEIHKLRGQLREVEEKLTTTKEELRMMKWDLQRSQRTAEDNFTACVREREKRHEKEIWLAEDNVRIEKERNALRDELAKRDMAENRRIIRERAKIRASPKNPRRFSQASPIIAEVPQTPVRSPTNIRSGAGTIVRSRKNETPKKVKNTNSPKSISKDDQRRNKAIDGVKGKEGAMFLKTLAVTSAIGLVGWAKEGGYF